jgi:hypothetical protein
MIMTTAYCKPLGIRTTISLRTQSGYYTVYSKTDTYIHHSIEYEILLRFF